MSNPIGYPSFEDRFGWSDPECYSTIQTATVKDNLYLIARGHEGLRTYLFNAARKNWALLVASNNLPWSDESGWGDVANYSTIQTAVVNNELYLLARGNAGMLTYKLKRMPNTPDWGWTLIAAGDPSWSDQSGWSDPANYSTIQAAVVKNELYLLARANDGMLTYKFDAAASKWTLLTFANPPWSDRQGWDDPTNYSTIQAVVFNDELYLLARANEGMLTYKLRYQSSVPHWNWELLINNAPAWSDSQGWNDPANYSTIQAAVANGELFLIARLNAGMVTYRLDVAAKHAQLVTSGPAWCDKSSWDPSNYSTNWEEHSHYSTIQTAVLKDKLYLLGRAWSGILTYRLEAPNNIQVWSRLAASDPPLSDLAGWNDRANYSTIQTAVLNDELYLLARQDAGMAMYKFNSGGNWQKITAPNPSTS